MEVKSYFHLSAFIFSLVVAISCNKPRQPENEPDITIDSVFEKIDSLVDTVGRDIKDVNEGVSGGVKELKDGETIKDSINK